MDFVKEMWEALFDDTGFAEPVEELHDRAALSEVLPYRLYDQETHLYYNAKSCGFILEAPAFVISEEVCANLHSALTAEMPPEAGIQFLNWSSPNIESELLKWGMARREGGALMSEMSQSRQELFRSKRFGTDHATKAIPHRRRIFVCGWIEGETSIPKTNALIAFRKAIATSLGIEDEIHSYVRPAGLLALLKELFHAEEFGEGSAHYAEQAPINEQLPGASVKVARNFLQFAGDPLMAATVSSVARFPAQWVESMGVLLNGHPDIIGDRPHGPVLTTFSAVATSKQKTQADIMRKSVVMDRAKKSGLANFEYDFAGKQKEFADLSRELDGSERLFETTFTVVAYSKADKEAAKAAHNEMAKIYRRPGISLRKETFMQFPMFLGALPLGMTKAFMATCSRLMRMRLLKGAAVSKLAPIHGETGGNTHGEGVLLTGRQGEVMTWSNYVSTGNYNTCVVGKSGAGKSVAMQEMVTSIYANNGRVLVIDDGYSFKTTCEILGGTHIVFDGSRDLKLNPFSMLQAAEMAKKEYRAEAIELVAAVVASMVDLGDQLEGRVRDVEEAFIASAVSQVWDSKGQNGEITDVFDVLLEKSADDPRLVDVCTKLKRFCKDGPYGQYFVGPANLSIENAFTVVEMSDIKSQKALEQVVLQIVMFLGSELMYKTDRKIKVAILIDEAWDMLQGHGTAKFIEGVARRARKYTGALITGTQSIDDYFANAAANVCYQNSDWLVMLAQKGETLDRLVADKKLALPEGFAGRLKTITSVAGAFSEMAVRGPEGHWFFGRLMLDKFSLAVYSSKGSTVEGINARKERGMTTVEAIHDMIEKGEVQ
jgi:conjugal transfer ATP-binding protein TraC